MTWVPVHTHLGSCPRATSSACGCPGRPAPRGCPAPAPAASSPPAPHPSPVWRRPRHGKAGAARHGARDRERRAGGTTTITRGCHGSTVMRATGSLRPLSSTVVVWRGPLSVDMAAKDVQAPRRPTLREVALSERSSERICSSFCSMAAARACLGLAPAPPLDVRPRAVGGPMPWPPWQSMQRHGPAWRPVHAALRRTRPGGLDTGGLSVVWMMISRPKRAALPRLRLWLKTPRWLLL